MPINVRAGEDTGELTVEFVGPWQGLDTKSPPMQIAENHLPGLQNVDLPEGVPTRVDGFALHATSFDTGTSVPNLLARYIPSTGDAFYITACATALSTGQTRVDYGLERLLKGEGREIQKNLS